MRESALILLQTVPTHIQIDSLQRKLLQEIDGVLAVHEFHVWQLAGDRIIASAHIRCRNLHDYMQIAEKVKEFFHNEGIHSTTIQPEFVEFEQSEKHDQGPAWFDENGVKSRWNDANCALDCPSGPNNDCVQNTCCGPQQKRSPNLSDLEDVEISQPSGKVVHRNRRSLMKENKPPEGEYSDNSFHSVKILGGIGGGPNTVPIDSKHITLGSETNISNYSNSNTTPSSSNEKINTETKNNVNQL